MNVMRVFFWSGTGSFPRRICNLAASVYDADPHWRASRSATHAVFEYLLAVQVDPGVLIAGLEMHVLELPGEVDRMPSCHKLEGIKPGVRHMKFHSYRFALQGR